MTAERTKLLAVETLAATTPLRRSTIDTGLIQHTHDSDVGCVVSWETTVSGWMRPLTSVSHRPHVASHDTGIL